MMRRRFILCSLVTLTALMGCVPTSTPGPVPSATSVPTSTVTPIPSATASPSPTPDPRVIDARPESLMLTLEEAGLESTHIISNCEAREEAPEDPGAGVRISGWLCNYLALNSNLGTNLLLGLNVHPASRDVIDAPVLNPAHASYLRDLDIGDRGAILLQSSASPDGATHHQYTVVFAYRNIFFYASAGGDSASEGLIDWLTNIAFKQFQKLQTIPLSDEVLDP